MEECYVCTENKDHLIKYCLFCNYKVCLNCVNDLMINFKNKCTICKKNIPYGYNNIVDDITNNNNHILGVYLYEKRIYKSHVSIKYKNHVIKDVFVVSSFEGGTLLTNYNNLPLEKFSGFKLMCNFNKISYIVNPLRIIKENILVIHGNNILLVTDDLKERKKYFKLNYKDIKKYYIQKKDLYNNLIILNNNCFENINYKYKNNCWNFLKNLFK